MEKHKLTIQAEHKKKKVELEFKKQIEENKLKAETDLKMEDFTFSGKNNNENS